jgi:hypothetical protein
MMLSIHCHCRGAKLGPLDDIINPRSEMPESLPRAYAGEGGAS